jgi:hypothetical protein
VRTVLNYPSAGQIPKPFNSGAWSLFTYVPIAAAFLIDTFRLDFDYDLQRYTQWIASALALTGVAAAVVSMIRARGVWKRFVYPVIAIALALLAWIGSTPILVR